MTMIEIKLPDEVAQRAKNAGLLSDTAILQLLEEAMRRRTGRALLKIAQEIQDDGTPPMSMEEIDAEVKSHRVERRARLLKGNNPSDDASRS